MALSVQKLTSRPMSAAAFKGLYTLVCPGQIPSEDTQCVSLNPGSLLDKRQYRHGVASGRRFARKTQGNRTRRYRVTVLTVSTT